MRRAAFAAFFLGATAALGAAEWSPTTWQGEPAYVSSSTGWRAVVSVARARLMHFGPEASPVNLLLAPADRENRNRLGGHRLWLGPQTEWPGFWPPPDAWEYREAAAVTVQDGVLRLALADAGDGWPRLVRTYRWDGARLVCGAESSGGVRAAQFIHILQVPPDALVHAVVEPADAFPLGYVRLMSTAGPFAAKFFPPAEATLAGSRLSLRHTGTVGKYGFVPQELVAERAGYELVVARGVQTGEIVGEPDEGFHTQVYLSAPHEAFIELEQLSPRFAAGRPARFEMVVAGRARRAP